jgi:hypothetical protein
MFRSLMHSFFLIIPPSSASSSLGYILKLWGFQNSYPWLAD